MTVTLQTSPYLRTQRQFPNEDVHELANQMDHAYIDIAGKINDRTIGIYAVNFPLATGEKWYLQGAPTKQQTLRQVYRMNGYAPITHGINFINVSTFTFINGVGYDGTNYFPIPYVTQTIANGNVGIYVSPTQINFTSGVGSPVIVSGIIVLEWLSNF